MATNPRKDYYATLRVARDATPDTIRKAYRRLARKFHPDVNPGDAVSEDRFKEIQEAYDVLSDQQKREFYDRHGFYADQAFSGAGGTAGRRGGVGFDGFDFSDFGHPGRTGQGPDFGSLFESFFGGGRRQGTESEAPQAGEDLEYTLDIGFDDAINGTTVRLNIARLSTCGQCAGSGSAKGAPPSECAACNGSGQVHQAAGNMRFTVPCPRCRGQGRVRSVCSTCDGEGRVRETTPIEARIPPGTQENSRLRIPRKGNAGVRGGKSGDLYIVARVGKHSFFKREGYDIHIQVPITPAEAILGGKIEVPTIDGTALLRIPPATSSGKTFRVRERGVKNPRGGKRGDQFVRISIVVPEIPDESTKDLMRRYEKENPENPRASLLRSK